MPSLCVQKKENAAKLPASTGLSSESIRGMFWGSVFYPIFTNDINLIYWSCTAWYDETTQYQRTDTELEKTFEERQTQQRQGTIDHRPELKPKIVKEPETEWQQSVKKKKGEEYYNKLQELENEQVVKESRFRESTHQYAIPGEKVVSSSVAKGMAQKYQDTL